MWVDLASPSPRQVERVGATLGLHELIVEDVLEGNQRPKVEVTDGLIHLVLFHLDYGDEGLVSVEIDFVLGPGFLLSVHDRAWDPHTAHHLRGGVESLLAAARTTCCGRCAMTSSTATSRWPTALAMRSMRCRTTSCGRPVPRHSSGCSGSSASSTRSAA